MFVKVLVLHVLFISCDAAVHKKPKPYVIVNPNVKYSNPNFMHDRNKTQIHKPHMPDSWKDRHRQPFNDAWMDYCDPYHCDDYHKTTCGLNRHKMKFKWFQSGCHLIINNQCSTYRGALKYDIVDVRYCQMYVLDLRTGCPTVCGKEVEPTCALSPMLDQAVLFRNRCNLDMVNCEAVAEGLDVNLKCTNQLQTDSTLAVQDRVALLKLQIAQEIKKNQFGHEKLYPIDNHDFGASYEYEDVNKRITPIMDFDERKKHDKFKMRKIKTTTEKEIEAFPKKFHVKKSRKRERPRSADTKDGNLEDKSPKKGYGYSSDESSSKEKVVLRGIEAAFSETKRKPIQGRFSTRPILAKNEHDDDEAGNIARHSNNSISSLIQPLIVDRQKHKRKHKNIFYRRNFFSTKHIRPEWIHCQDLVTPFLKGDKTNMTQGRQLSHGDNAVRRLLQLLSEDTSDDTLEDIFSLIYQISNLQIRLFQWDTPALKTLLNVISREPRKVHTFRTLKAALKKMFDSWHLDLFGNTTNLLKQSRLYRPPCIRITPYEGSTKTSKGVRYSKSLRVQSTKDEDDANDDEDC